jgi:hypothetical protein
VNHILNLIKNNNYSPDKNILPDIGNFFMLLFFSNRDTHGEKMKKMWYVLFEELAIRQAYWIFHESDNKAEIEKIIKRQHRYFQLLEEDPNFDVNDNKKFFEDIQDKGILYEINDEINGEYTTYEEYMQKREKMNEEIKKSFKKYYNDCDKKVKEKLKNILTTRLNISEYFNSKKIPEIAKQNKRYRIESLLELYNSYKVEDVLKNLNKDILNDLLKYIFDSQKGNKLLIITFFTQKKIEDKEFMKELQNNYGIYLDVDVFIKEMNQQLNTIDNYHDFFNYIGSDFGKNMNDVDILIHCYKMAKQKNYIKTSYNNNYNQFQNNRGGRGDFRGRGYRGGGRGRGRGRGDFRGRGRGGHI